LLSAEDSHIEVYHHCDPRFYCRWCRYFFYVTWIIKILDWWRSFYSWCFNCYSWYEYPFIWM